MSMAKYLKRSVEKDGKDLERAVDGRHPFEVVFSHPPSDDEEEATSSHTSSSVPEYSDRWDSAANGKLAIFTSAGVTASEKIAGYDMDGTIIKTKSGWDFPADTYDWQIIFPEVPEKLKNLHRNGFKICFFKPLRAIQFYLVIIVKILFRAYLPFKGEKNAIKKMPTKLQVVQVVLPAAL